MGLLKIKCPECNAGLKSPTGFTAGQTVCCPKCETYFAVEEPDEDEADEPKPSKSKEKPSAKKSVKAAAADDDDEEDEKPKKKKRSEDDEDDEERSYKNSPLRFVILGVLVLVMVVLGVMLVMKKRREAETADAPVATNTPDPDSQPIVRPNVPVQKGNNNPKLPVGGKQKLPAGGGGKGPDVGAIADDALGGLFGGGFVPPALAQELTQKFKTALVGSWTADLGNGVTEELTYTAGGTFTAKRAGAEPATGSGKYTVKGLVGTKGLKIQLDTAIGARTIIVVFEDDELIHPSLKQGVSAAFRKK